MIRIWPFYISYMQHCLYILFVHIYFHVYLFLFVLISLLFLTLLFHFILFYLICTFTFILIFILIFISFFIFICIFVFFFILTLDAIGPPSSRRNGFGKQVKDVFRKSKEEFKNLIEEVEDSCKESI